MPAARATWADTVRSDAGYACRALRRLEHQLQRELALPRRESRADGAKGGVGGFRVRYPEIRVVQNVEELGPELQPGLFADLEVLVNRAVPLVEVGSAERIASHIAKWLAGGRSAECVAGEKSVQHGGTALADGSEPFGDVGRN